jgi:hypothetical protein
MLQITKCLTIALVALAMGGCFGDRAADRTLTIYQMQSTDTYGGQFEIDASQLPPDAIKARTDSGGKGIPVTMLTLDQRYSVRVVLVPVKRP